MENSGRKRYGTNTSTFYAVKLLKSVSFDIQK